MNTNSPTLTLSQLVKQLLFFWSLMVLALFLYCDLKEQAMLANSDYLMTFHTAGWIAGHGQWQILYPGPGAATFHGEPFDLKAHELLPFLKDYSVAEYMYMPLSAFVFAPFALLPANLSLLAFQLFSLLTAYICSGLLGVSTKSKDSSKPKDSSQQKDSSEPKRESAASRALLPFLALLVFLPAFLTLWIGQVGIIFGLFPLSLAYFLLVKKKDFAAGLILSLLSLKPQLLVPALFLVFGRLAVKKFSLLFGLLSGLVGIFAANYLVLGSKLFGQWLQCLALSDRVYSDPAMGVPVRLATSLPRALLFSRPVEERLFLKPFIYAFAALLIVAGLLVLWRACKTLAEEDQVRLALILGSLALPCVVPHMFIYDLCVLAPAAYLILTDGSPSKASPFRHIRPFLLLLWLAVNLYCIMVMSVPDWVSPLLLCSLMLLVYLASALPFLKTKSKAVSQERGAAS
jgi:hypothetical protein